MTDFVVLGHIHVYVCVCVCVYTSMCMCVKIVLETLPGCLLFMKSFLLYL